MMGIRTFGILFAGLAFVAGMIGAGTASAQDLDYVGQKKCKMCHNKQTEGRQWTKWTESKHAKALETLASDKAKEYAAAAGLATPPEESPECLRCHVTAYDAGKNVFHPAVKKEDGVQCESCHGPSSAHLVYGKKMMLSKDDIDPTVPTEITRPDVETCLKCHNDESPAWNPEKYELEDGTKTGFDYDQEFAKIDHLNPLKKRD